MALLSWFELGNQTIEICDEKTRNDVIEIKKEIQQLSNFFYPVGSIYMSYDGSITPDKLFGGKWEQITDTFLYCSNNSGNKGGEKEHTLSVEEMPVHTHAQLSHTHLQNEHNHTQNEHTHTQNEHTHGQSTHAHTLGKHNHLMTHSHEYNGDISGRTDSDGNHHHTAAKYVNNVQASGTNLPRWYSANSSVTESGHVLTSDGGEHSHNFSAHYSGTTIDISNNYTELGGGGETGSNSSTIYTATAINNNTVAINNPVIATNIETTAINENTGGGKSFDIMPPYTTIFAWKRLTLV